MNHWSHKMLTVLGPNTLIKSLFLPKFNHLFTSLPNPLENFITDLRKLLFNFLWNGKPDRIKRTQITQDYFNGGIRVPNIENYIKAMKLTWVRGLLTKRGKMQAIADHLYT